MQLKTRSDIVLYVWDYFYIANMPQRGDELAWKRIERATCRIYESDHRLDAPTPPDIRLQAARRVRNAVRLALREIAGLSRAPEAWVVDGLLVLGGLIDEIIQTVSSGAAEVVVH